MENVSYLFQFAGLHWLAEFSSQNHYLLCMAEGFLMNRRFLGSALKNEQWVVRGSHIC